METAEEAEQWEIQDFVETTWLKLQERKNKD